MNMDDKIIVSVCLVIAVAIFLTILIVDLAPLLEQAH